MSRTQGTGPVASTRWSVTRLNVSTPLTPGPDHLVCLYFVGCVKQVSNLLNRLVMGLLVSRMCDTRVKMITKDIKDIFFGSKVEGGNVPIVGIFTPTDSVKKVCHHSDWT